MDVLSETISEAKLFAILFYTFAKLRLISLVSESILIELLHRHFHETIGIIIAFPAVVARFWLLDIVCRLRELRDLIRLGITRVRPHSRSIGLRDKGQIISISLRGF